MDQIMSFPMPSPEAYMIEEMLEIEGEEDRVKVQIVGVMERFAKLEDKWVGTPYMMVADACKIKVDWDPVRGGENRDTLLEWMMMHNTMKLVEEAGHMIASWDTQ